MPQSSEYYWSTYLGSVLLGSSQVADSGALAIFDSGTSINHLPSRDYQLVMEIIKKGKTCTERIDPSDPVYCECDANDVSNFPNFVFSFGEI